MYYDDSTRAYLETPNRGEFTAAVKKLEELEEILDVQKSVSHIFLSISHYAVINALKIKRWRLISTNSESGVIKFAKGNRNALLAYLPSEDLDPKCKFLTLKLKFIPQS